MGCGFNMKKKILVLGVGYIGRPMTIDLAKDSDKYDVTAADINPEVFRGLDESINTQRIDLTDYSGLEEFIKAKEFDLVINAVPDRFGHKTLKSIINTGTEVVDIAFSFQDPLILSDLAERTGSTAIVDCGVAPGMSNLCIGDGVRKLDEIKNVIIYVGGNPLDREKVYFAPFTPESVFEELTRKARVLENGHIIEYDPLERENIATITEFPNLGDLKAFYNDGLRTMLTTMTDRISNMVEWTLRYPEHLDQMVDLKEMGYFKKGRVYFGEEFITIDELNAYLISINRLEGEKYFPTLQELGFSGSSRIQTKEGYLIPIEVAGGILYPAWKMQPEDKDVTTMKIVVEGRQGDKEVTYTYDLQDVYDDETGTTSMARTTGYTATNAARLLLDTDFLKQRKKKKGGEILPLEIIGLEEPSATEFIINKLEESNIHYRITKS